MIESKIIRGLAAGIAAMVLSACDVDQTREGELPDVDVEAKAGQLPKYDIQKTQEGELPEVDVDVSGGQLPEYDVDVADVDIGTREAEISVPDVDVDMEKKRITVPDVDVHLPDDEEER